MGGSQWRAGSELLRHGTHSPNPATTRDALRPRRQPAPTAASPATQGWVPCAARGPRERKKERKIYHTECSTF
jgi:hypothetical protein